MASFPQRPRRAPARQASDSSFQQVQRQDSEAVSATSIDSQTLLLGDTSTTSSSSLPSSSSATNANPSKPSEQTSESEPPSSTTKTDPTTSSQTQPGDDVRRCWICYSDDTDDQTPRTWRSPCACSLTAHESCLLDWVADLERPANRQTVAGRAEIKCPQCKTSILLKRPTNKIVDVFGTVERMASLALIPAAVGGLGYSVLLVLSHHGVHTIRRIFGDRDSMAILGVRSPAEWNPLERGLAARFPNLVLPVLREWRGLRVELGLPFIPAALVLSRVTFGDALLTFLPTLFFATYDYAHGSGADGVLWPPSASLTLCFLPYVRSLYNEYMSRVWADRERRWTEEIRPDLRSENQPGNTQGDDDEAAAAAAEEAGGIMNIRVDVRIEDDEHDDDSEGENDDDDEEGDGDRVMALLQDRLEAGNGDGAAVRIEGLGNGNEIPREALEEIAAEVADMNNQLDEIEQAIDQVQDDAAAQPEGAPRRRRQGGQRGQGWDTQIDLARTMFTVAETSAGALFFPSIAALSGDVLKLLLPSSLTTPPAGAKLRGGLPTGWLQTKWGRSIVGGCLFVVLKDAIRIYCRWRMAVSFRERKVRDYDKKKGVYL